MNVVEIPAGTVLTMQTQFGTRKIVKLCNDEFSGIPDRPIAYFTFADKQGMTLADFKRSMRGESRGPKGDAFAIWQFQVDGGQKMLTEA